MSTLDLASSVKLVLETVKAVEQTKPAETTPQERQKQREEFLALPSNMSLQKQCEELRKHANTPMTYAEMRERFG